MSQNINGIPVIEAEPDFICSECGKIAETRPYGHNGAEICFECGKKILEIVNHNMGIILYGDKGDLW